MANKPFLTNFAIDRSEGESKVNFKYDSKLDLNIIEDQNRLNEQIVCSTQTYTKVLNESPDQDVNYWSNIFYSTQTYTEVRTEKPDSDITEMFLNG